eukprot:scaffold109194_cov29-Phaeocystis_antarctica.AAC.1
MSGMKSAAPRGAIAESRLQDHLGPYHARHWQQCLGGPQTQLFLSHHGVFHQDRRSHAAMAAAPLSLWRPKLPRYNPAPTTLNLRQLSLGYDNTVPA